MLLSDRGAASLIAGVPSLVLPRAHDQLCHAERRAAEGLGPAESKPSTTGVIIATYEPAGALKTGSFQLAEPGENVA